MKFWSAKFVHETETKRKIGLEFFRKPILLHDLEKFSTLSQYGYLRSGVGFVRLSNQNITLIGIRDKMEDLGEKMIGFSFWI